MILTDRTEKQNFDNQKKLSVEKEIMVNIDSDSNNSLEQSKKPTIKKKK